ncbi:MAG: 50S ribosomal protein L25/general stress protein Ctc [Helicobacter sp.]|nr:50S ribosomal protein L25/general stress protein Ctc [Helicobacter sp.]
MLEGKIRESISKASTKALRKDGYLIANIYGKGALNVHCAFKNNDFIREVKAKQSLVFQVSLDGKIYDVAIKEYQRDVVSGQILHVDLLLAQKGIKANYKVPVRSVGIPVGLKNKGVLLTSKKVLTVFGAPEDIPSAFEINVEKLDIGDSILVRDIPINANIQILEKPAVAILGVVKAK